jgi:hypothetical protein
MRYGLLILAAGIAVLVFFNTGFSAEAKKVSVSTEDLIVGSTFKTLAKLFISSQNKDRLIDSLTRMDEQKFQRRYTRVYAVIKDSTAILNRYGFKQDTTKTNIISKIKTMDKKEMLAVIDSISDTAITRQFRLYLLERKQTLENSNSVEQMVGMWNRLIKNMGLNR